MSSHFTLGALALADRRANAVGAVRFSLLPEALEIELVRASGFAEGFAPGSVAEAVRYQVPYTAVRGLVRQGRTLMLTLDPAIASPHTRFALAGFTDDPAEALARAWQARALARWASYLLPAPLGALLGLFAPASLVSGWVGRASLGILGTGLLWLGLRELLARRTWGGAASDQLRDDFELKLSRKLGVIEGDRAAPALSLKARRLRPTVPLPVNEPVIPDLLVPAPRVRALPPIPLLAIAPMPDEARPSSIEDRLAPVVGEPATPVLASAPLPATLPSSPPPLQSLDVPAQARAPELLRAALPPRRAPRVLRPALLLVAASVGAVGVMLFLQRFAGPKAPPPAVPTLAKGLASAVARVRADDKDPLPLDPALEARPRCVCLRADSPLWKDGFPALQVLTYESDEQVQAGVAAHADRKGNPRYVFDVAVVDNASRPQHDVRVTLTFARRNKAGARIGAVDRGLFWSGALAPGHAVKWHVKAPGSEVTMDTSVRGALEKDGIEAAPADAFFELTSSRVQAVRAHAVTMLAYLGDPRARDAALALSGRSADERAYLARIARAASPLRVCEVERVGDHLNACVFNATVQAKTGVELRSVPASPEAGEAARYAIGGVVPVHEGIRVEVPAEGEGIGEWEAVVEHADKAREAAEPEVAVPAP